MEPIALKVLTVHANIPPRRSTFLNRAELPRVCMAMNFMRISTEQSFATKIGATKKFVGLLTDQSNSYAEFVEK